MNFKEINDHVKQVNKDISEMNKEIKQQQKETKLEREMLVTAKDLTRWTPGSFAGAQDDKRTIQI